MYADEAGRVAHSSKRALQREKARLGKRLARLRARQAASPPASPPSDPDLPTLELREAIDPPCLEDLIETDPRYAAWLRVVLLRLLVRTPALGRLKERMDFSLSQVCEFLGFENFEAFSAGRTLSQMRRELGKVLARWEPQAGTPCRFPGTLRANLQALARVVGLNELEQEVLGLAILVHTELVLDHGCNLLGPNLGGHNIERVLAPMLGREPEAVAACIARSGVLATSGLLTIDLRGQYPLRQLMDLMTSAFPVRMLQPQPDIRKVVEGFVRPLPASSLGVADYAHLGLNLDASLSLLRHALAQRVAGINILVYGKPGSGKTEFARLLASELQVQLMEISPTNSAGAPVAPAQRVRSYRVAQSFLRAQPSIILFDECEEVLNPAGPVFGDDDEAAVPRKSWINRALEMNPVPTIWIGNSIHRFDEAYVRRFSLCFEMPLPSQAKREKILAGAFDDRLGAQAMSAIARHRDATPGILAQVAGVVSAIAQDHAPQQRDALALHLVNNTLRAQGKPALDTPTPSNLGGHLGFDPRWINCQADLLALREGLGRSREGRLCLYGPPGTGKTAFGRWLAETLDAPHLVFKASDLLSPYLGETEQNMARAFESARQQGAVLQFDEVDSFLQDRRKASRAWEVSQVNEMLTQMERFQGLFLASTNLFQDLDDASLRRFDLALKFDFMSPQSAWAMFCRTCEGLGLQGVQEVEASRLQRLVQLTPGDFEQAARRARLVGLASAQQLLAGLEAAVALKPPNGARPMGFLCGG